MLLLLLFVLEKARDTKMDPVRTGTDSSTKRIALWQWRRFRRTGTFTIQSVEAWWRRICLGRGASLEIENIPQRYVKGREALSV